MKYNVKFSPERRKGLDGAINCENVPLLADVRFAGSRFFYFTGYRLTVDWNKINGDWNFDKDEVRKGKTVKEGVNLVPYSVANARLTKIRHELDELFKGAPNKKNIIDRLNEVCKKGAIKDAPAELEFYPMFEKYAREAKLSAGKLKHINCALSDWKRFNSKLTFKDMNSDTLRAFEKFLLNEKSTPKDRNDTPKQLRGKNRVAGIMKLTRTFWNHCREVFRENKKTLHYPFESYKMPAEVYGDPIYLTKEERDRIINAKIESEKLERVRDIFIFQCLIGARVGDLCRLTRDNIQDGVLSYIARKTKEGHPVTVTVPLSEKAKGIIAKYNIPGGMLLPFITDQRYNDYLKELAKLDNIKLDRIVTRLNSLTGEPEQVILYDIISSHMARRTFVGNLIGKVDESIIKSMTSHTKDSKAFGRYYNVSVELQQKAINLID